MAIDFPNSPSDGDLVTIEGTTWVWKATPGLWAVVNSGIPVEIVGADAAAGWTVFGDYLICLGAATTDVNGQLVVSYPQAFNSLPIVSATCGGGVNGHFVQVENGTETVNGCTLEVRRYDNVDGQQGVRWFAIGEAPAALKKPKSVQAVGGSVLREYHDPTGALSWQIVGTTLKCWGKVTTDSNGSATVSFPKSFARPPVTSVNIPASATTTIARTVNGYADEDGFTQISARTISGGVVSPYQGEVSWKATGEWDGV